MKHLLLLQVNLPYWYSMKTEFITLVGEDDDYYEVIYPDSNKEDLLYKTEVFGPSYEPRTGYKNPKEISDLIICKPEDKLVAKNVLLESVFKKLDNLSPSELVTQSEIDYLKERSNLQLRLYHMLNRKKLGYSTKDGLY